MTRPLKILAIGYATSTHVVNRVRCFCALGHEVYLLSTPAAGLTEIIELTPSVHPGRDEWITRLARWGSKLVRRDLSGLSDMARLFFDFRRLIRTTNPDIIHVHYAYSTWAWLAGALGFRPLVVSVMGGDVLFEEQGAPTPRGIALTKRLFAVADRITAKSDFLITKLNELGGYGDKATRVVWGVDPEQFRPLDASALRAECGIPNGARVVLSPKILQPFYNIDVLVEAMASVVKRVPSAHLVVTEYGADPQYRAELTAQIEALGLTLHVSFVGRISYDQMPLFYSMAEVAVGIPHSDGLPQTLLEAMACGVPSVVGRLDRYGEIVKDGENVLFADIDPTDVANTILRLLEDEALRERIAATGRDIVVKVANFPIDVQRVEAIYRELASKPRRRALYRPLMLIDVARYWLRV
ncbi:MULTISPECIES: glycosyltransferase family 4 protein [unclassified Bradyrhizobium]|uniref:glycosyltransferase family 4 protein n=1 Tax=unclassified Bradyrhizobium TaxID=2631580 RepID=UPI001BAB1C6F|nr:MULTISPECIES: glycosyltransferase family 4 protein [unclassified Bradyrhizobium]MBR1203966.1 glycosyltransferase family 4 protein [Bradyrhizobium sp. AUGA SZCCT0124]MBR1310148.1 glycosyltransferase family 4 protein [Bradyrhizobium sp. AUGA SZCCT0051]MBR1340289.1 glycosyltransferase family 4 protein [Bradyrhizobium sp. AUGA SZCCT0105]MBR1354896.1 glycosyltransferase family 4 protein [Bradyrhizobium sp. AUGA SZCCT0045]